MNTAEQWVRQVLTDEQGTVWIADDLLSAIVEVASDTGLTVPGEKALILTAYEIFLKFGISDDSKQALHNIRDEIEGRSIPQ